MSGGRDHALSLAIDALLRTLACSGRMLGARKSGEMALRR
jgi:hypothetical protein